MIKDQQLLALLNNNPERGLEQLMNCYAGYVYTIVNNKLNSICTESDIEECVSDVFYDAYESRNKIDLQKGSIKAFICVISKRRAIDTYRLFSKHKEISSCDIESFGNIESESANIDIVITDKETKSQIMRVFTFR